jgi:hypothetical protein
MGNIRKTWTLEDKETISPVIIQKTTKQQPHIDNSTLDNIVTRPLRLFMSYHINSNERTQ